jgi:hypothetical protein
MTPPINILQPSCIRVIFQTLAALWVSARYLNENGTYVEQSLHRTLLPVANQWSQLFLDVDAPPTSTPYCLNATEIHFDRVCDQMVVIAFRTEATNDGTASAMIADVAFFNGTKCQLIGQ